jgi:hypothetical protein
MFAASKTLIVAAALALVPLTNSTANAQWRGDHSHSHNGSSFRYERIHSLARQLERDARFMLSETHAHFRGAPSYRQFDAQVHEIERLADHIHELVDRRASFFHVRNDVDRLDRLYHSTERLFDAMVSWRRLDPQTAVHVRRALNRVERDVHALRELMN